MGQPGPIIPPVDLTIVLEILAKHLPETTTVSVFGSRARGERVRPLSDLDLAIDAGLPLTLADLARLRDVLSEAAIAYKVDLLDRRQTGEVFGAVIDRDAVPLLGWPRRL